MVFSDPLMFWECRGTSLLMRIQPNHHDAFSWSYSLTELNETFYIHPRSLELSAKFMVCSSGNSC